MGKFIEEFYYGNIDPQARSTKQNKAVQKQMEVLMLNVWGQRHLRYIKQHRRIFYANLMTTGQLNSHLAEIDRGAEEMFERLVGQMAQAEGITEGLKAANQMAWVGKMNSVRNRAMEIVNADLIYM